MEHRPIHAQARIASIFAALSAIVVASAGLGICLGAMGSVFAISCLLEQSADRRSRGVAAVAGPVCAAVVIGGVIVVFRRPVGGE